MQRQRHAPAPPHPGILHAGVFFLQKNMLFPRAGRFSGRHFPLLSARKALRGKERNALRRQKKEFFRRASLYLDIFARGQYKDFQI